MNPKPIKVFLSYSRKDQGQAELLYANLIDQGLEVWFDKESLLPGQDWEMEIIRSIEEADFVILLLSNNSVARRGFFQKEMRLTLDVLQTIPVGHVYMLPARLNDCAIPSHLAHVHCVDLFPNRERGLEKLFRSIELQREIQSEALALQDQDEQEELPTVLLVNDEPSTMNFVVDVWKKAGMQVEYAFNVPQALQMIQELSPSVVVSDLSHYSMGRLVTKRAGFEILEWAQQNRPDTRVIITTSVINEKQRKLAQELGAEGICNTIVELNDLIVKNVGLEIEFPRDLIPLKSQDEKKSVQTRGAETPNNNVFITYSRRDTKFVERLATDLSTYGINVIYDMKDVQVGASWDNVVEEMIRSAGAMIAIMSRNSITSEMVKEEINVGLAMERIREYNVIPVMIDDLSPEDMPFNLFQRQFITIDFNKRYQEGLEALTQQLKWMFQ